MKLALLAAAMLALTGPVLAQPAGDMGNMVGMTGAQSAGHPSMTMADGAGVVTAVDVRAGAVTIHHGPIAKLSWPAMTMTFKATPPTLLQGIKVGQSVTFKLMQMHGSTTLTAIQPK